MFDINALTPYFDYRSTNFAISTTARQICGNEPQRVCLYFQVGQGSSVSILMDPTHSFNSPDFTVITNGLLRLTWPLDGILTTIPWFAGATGINATVNVIEVWYRPGRGRC
jgi:hypothetical protein